MLKRFLIAAAVAACIGALPALAQTPPPSNTPAASKDTGQTPAAKTDADKTDTKTTAHAKHVVHHVTHWGRHYHWFAPWHWGWPRWHFWGWRHHWHAWGWGGGWHHRWRRW
jgi:hypothetical protein